MHFVSKKVKSLPVYLFSEFQRKKKLLQQNGVDVIDLGIGAPDLSPPSFVMDELKVQLASVSNHRYSMYSGCEAFKEAVAQFYSKQYDVTLDPETEVLALIGSKEGIVHLVQTVINPNDSVLIPDPGYPVYKTAVELAGGTAIPLRLQKENNFIPQFDDVRKQLAERTKLMFLNYPSNPTAATIQLSTFTDAISFAKKYNILVAHDAAYNLITFNHYKAPSILQVKGARSNAVEFGSLSKSFNMTGWRIGYVVGNKDVIQALTHLKSNIDTSQFLPIQKAAAVALNSDFSAVERNNKIYKERMEAFYSALQSLGMHAEKPRGTIFIWAQVPLGYTSWGFANDLLDQAGVIVTPGSIFGKSGEGYVRIALTVTTDRLKEAIFRMKQLHMKGGNRN